MTCHLPLVRLPAPTAREGGSGSNPCSGVRGWGRAIFDCRIRMKAIRALSWTTQGEGGGLRRRGSREQRVRRHQFQLTTSGKTSSRDAVAAESCRNGRRGQEAFYCFFARARGIRRVMVVKPKVAGYPWSNSKRRNRAKSTCVDRAVWRSDRGVRVRPCRHRCLL